MIAVGMFLLFAAYGLGFWGFSLLEGYNLGFKQLFSPTAYYTGKWPPALAGDTVIVPDGTSASLNNGTVTPFTTTAAAGSSTAPAAPAGVTGQAQIQQAAASFGWGSGSQFAALLQIIAHESGGNPSATNPDSGAYGIAQALGHGTSGSACPATGRNEYGANYGLSTGQAQLANCGGAAGAWYQLLWMLGYIKAAYGTPSAAWAQYCAHPGGVCWY
jgi:hypothetical protein